MDVSPRLGQLPKGEDGGMYNHEIAKILYEVSTMLEMRNLRFIARRYWRAATSIGALEEPAEEIYKIGGTEALMRIPGFEKRVAKDVEKLIKTGKLGYHERLKKRAGVNSDSLSVIEYPDPRTIKTLHDQLGIRDIDGLEKAAREHRISRHPLFTERTEENILKWIETVRKKQRESALGAHSDHAQTIRSETGVTKEPSQMSHCIVCGAVVTIPSASYCWNCGARIEARREANTGLDTERCMICNLEIKKGDRTLYCPYCGNRAHRNHLLEWIHTHQLCPNCSRTLNRAGLEGGQVER